MLWVAAESWGWLVLSALAGAGLTTALTLRRSPVDPASDDAHDAHDAHDVHDVQGAHDDRPA